MYKAFQQTAKQFSILIPNEVEAELQKIPPGSNNDLSKQLALVKKSGAKIIAFLGSSNEAFAVMKEAFKQGLFGKEYVWVLSSSSVSTNTYIKNGIPDLEVQEVMHGMIGIVEDATSNLSETFTADYKAYNDTVNALREAKLTSLEPNVYTPYAYDLAFIWGRTLDSVSS